MCLTIITRVNVADSVRGGLPYACCCRRIMSLSSLPDMQRSSYMLMPCQRAVISSLEGCASTSYRINRSSENRRYIFN